MKKSARRALVALVSALLYSIVACSDGPSPPTFPGGQPVPAVIVASLTLSATAVTGGVNLTGTVTLTAAAPAGGFAIALSSSDPSASVPASLTVAAGATSAAFTVTTLSVATDVDATIAAGAGGVTRTAALRISAPAGSGPLASFASAHDDLIGGEDDRGTIVLAAPAPAGGATVRLSSDDASIRVPAAITIQAGAREGTFKIQTLPVAAQEDVRLTATFPTESNIGGGRIARSAASSLSIFIRLLPAPLVPDAPALTAIDPASGVQGTSVAVTLGGSSFTDGAAVAVSGSGITVADVTVVSATSIRATLVIAADAAAGARIVTVTTPAGLSTGITFAVADANDAPVAGNDSYSTDEDRAVTVTAPGVLDDDSDADGDPLTAVIVTNPANGSLTLEANGSFTYTPNPGFNGSDSFTYRANDGSASSNTASVTIAVGAINDGPTITGIADQTIDEDAATAVLPLTVGDAETAAGSLTVSGRSSNTTLVPAANIVVGGSGAGRTVTVTPDANQHGAAIITLTVSDGAASASETFTLTVNQLFDDSQTFAFTGAQQSFSVPAGTGRITVEALGAAGGAGGGIGFGCCGGAAAGLGGSVEATLTVTPGEALGVFVGGTGGAGDINAAGVGGFRGGAAGGNRNSSGGGGGGSSDVTRGAARLVVAGGGGGGGGFFGTIGGAGGAGGGLIGGSGVSTGVQAGRGGTQATGGTGGVGAAAASSGSDGASATGGAGASNTASGGGGGGGYFGGGGGAGGFNPTRIGRGAGGGGGSSFVDPAVLVGVASHQQGVRAGNGQVVIRW